MEAPAVAGRQGLGGQLPGAQGGQEGAVLIANHESFLDGLLLGILLPLRPTFVVHTGVLKIWYFRLILDRVPAMLNYTAGVRGMQDA